MRRHRKILRNNIQGITKSAIQRLGYKAGVRSMSGFVHDEVRGIIKIFLENVIKRAVTLAEYYQKKTVSEGLVSAALMDSGWGGRWIKSGSKVKTCKTNSKKKKKQRAPKGTGAVEAIRFYQNQSNCLLIPQAAFGRVIREVGQDYATNLRYTKGSQELLQFATEQYMVVLLGDAQLTAIHAKRLAIIPEDLALARRIRGERS